MPSGSGGARDVAPALRCPRCGAGHPGHERFCPDCGLPLVLAEPAAPPVSARRAQARKINPSFTQGPLVRVAGAHNQAEGEMLQGLLLEAGVPSLLRRSAGFDVPDFLAAGPRDVLVPQAGADAAREVLRDTGLIGASPPAVATSPGRLFAGLLLAFAVGALVIWLISLAVR